MNYEQVVDRIDRISQTHIDRRQALKWALIGSGVTTAVALVGKACGPASRKERSLSEMNQYITEGLNMRTALDKIELTTTQAGIDLPYSRLRTVDRIREISDPTKRVMAAIGFLDVEHNLRYSGVDNGTCNIYALDLLRLTLGNRYIGSRYNELTGTPQVLGRYQPEWQNEELRALFDRENPYLAAFNLDWWMRKYGPTHGWVMVQSQSDLDTLLRSGNHIALGVTKKENLPSGVVAGHSFVLTDSGNAHEYGHTQATVHTRFKRISSGDEKTKPGLIYNIHVHELPDFS